MVRDSSRYWRVGKLSYFNIANFDENDQTVEYSAGTILGDPDFRKSFYEEINDHFDWVREQLLAQDINVLKQDAVY